MSDLQGSFTCPLCHREYPISTVVSYESDSSITTATFDMTHVAQHLEDHARIEKVLVKLVDHSLRPGRLSVIA